MRKVLWLPLHRRHRRINSSWAASEARTVVVSRTAIVLLFVSFESWNVSAHRIFTSPLCSQRERFPNVMTPCLISELLRITNYFCGKWSRMSGSLQTTPLMKSMRPNVRVRKLSKLMVKMTSGCQWWWFFCCRLNQNNLAPHLLGVFPPWLSWFWMLCQGFVETIKGVVFLTSSSSFHCLR